MRIVFMGTSPFAADILRRLHRFAAETAGVDLVGVYCQPDRPAGRGHKLVAPPVKELAATLGLPVAQPLHFRNEEDRAALRALQPDVLAVAAYGLILPQAVLDIPSIGPFNVHASLLPRLRGAAPIERAVMQGDVQTGVTIMRMEAGLDTGPMLAQKALAIGLDDTGGDLHKELALLGGDLLVDVLADYLAGNPPAPVGQNACRATYAAKLTREDGDIDWQMPVREVHARLRGVTPRPGGRAVFELDGRTLAVKLTPGRFGRDFAVPFSTLNLADGTAPGTILGLHRGCLAIACADAAYLLPELCPAGKKAMPAGAFWNGYLRGVSTARALPGGQPDETSR